EGGLAARARDEHDRAGLELESRRPARGARRARRLRRRPVGPRGAWPRRRVPHVRVRDRRGGGGGERPVRAARRRAGGRGRGRPPGAAVARAVRRGTPHLRGDRRPARAARRRSARRCAGRAARVSAGLARSRPTAPAFDEAALTALALAGLAFWFVVGL